MFLVVPSDYPREMLVSLPDVFEGSMRCETVRLKRGWLGSGSGRGGGGNGGGGCAASERVDGGRHLQQQHRLFPVLLFLVVK